VTKRKPIYCKTLFPVGSILPNEEYVDDAVRELFESIGLTLTVDDLTLLSNNNERVPLPSCKHQIVYGFVANVLVLCVTANLRTPAKVNKAATAQSTINPDGSYVIPSTIDIDGLTLTPSKTILLKETQRKFELLHFGYAAQWEAFRGVVKFGCVEKRRLIYG
jgi:ADP-ribose pyrophosphatase YjhB (NUDIX family)